MKKLICTLLALLLLCPSVMAEAPFVYGYDFETNAVTEDVFSGNALTIVNVWGTFCGPCIAEMPFLGQLAGEYADRGVRIIGIVVDVGNDPAALEKARSIVETTGAGYLHLIPNEYLGTVSVCRVTIFPCPGSWMKTEINWTICRWLVPWIMTVGKPR